MGVMPVDAELLGRLMQQCAELHPRLANVEAKLLITDPVTEWSVKARQDLLAELQAFRRDHEFMNLEAKGLGAVRVRVARLEDKLSRLVNTPPVLPGAPPLDPWEPPLGFFGRMRWLFTGRV